MDLFLKFLTARFTQLVIKQLTYFCAFMFGADTVNSPDARTAIQQGGNWLVLMITGFAADLVIHSAVWGKLRIWWANYRARPADFGVLLIVAALGVATLGGCQQLPVNPTPSDIQRAQDSITQLELVYIAFTTPVDIEVSKPGFDAKKRQLIQAAEALIFAELEAAYVAAGQGKNIDAHQLSVDLAEFKAQVIEIENAL